MSICLATKGMICTCSKVTPTWSTYSPILKFDVALILDKPKGLLVQNVIDVQRPQLFTVRNMIDVLSTPRGFYVTDDASPATPAGFSVEDTTYVAVPRGFAAEDL